MTAKNNQNDDEPLHSLLRISAALVPPKPKLLDMANVHIALLRLERHQIDAGGDVGIFQIDGGAAPMPSRIASRQKIASTEPAAPRR